jgi:hypothetical protein
MLPSGLEYRIEPATGIASKSLRVKNNDETNWHYLPVSECQLNWEQKFEVIYLIQGGARAAVADIGSRITKGKLSMPLRVDSSGDLFPGVKSILRCAEFQPNGVYLQINTNHYLSATNGMVADDWVTNNIGLLDLDVCLISNISIESRSGGSVVLNCDVVGIIDVRSISDVVDLTGVDLSGRELMFADCKAYRKEARLPISMFETGLSSEINEDYYIPPSFAIPEQRTDQVQFISSKTWTTHGQYEQFVKKGIEKSSFLKGGIMPNQNMTFEIGPLKVCYFVPMFSTSTQNIDVKLIKRTVKISGLTSASYLENSDSNFFIYN